MNKHPGVDAYLYIFKHGIGPGTIPDDVNVVRVKDLPNYYTAVWLDRFLTTDELRQYDIPSETRITELLDRIGYCQTAGGDVVPCDDVEACDNITCATEIDPNKTVHFFCNGELIDECPADAIASEPFYNVMLNDPEIATAVMDYLNSFGDPIIRVSEDDWHTAETNIENVDIRDLYETFIWWIQHEYDDWGELYVDSIPGCEIFTGEVVDEYVASSTEPKYMANMVSCSDEIDGDYDWWNDIDTSLILYNKEFKQMLYDFRSQYGWPTDYRDPLCDPLCDQMFQFIKDHEDYLGIHDTDSEYQEFVGNRLLDWLLDAEFLRRHNFWAGYEGEL